MPSMLTFSRCPSVAASSHDYTPKFSKATYEPWVLTSTVHGCIGASMVEFVFGDESI